jgi:hypothetical protein
MASSTIEAVHPNVVSHVDWLAAPQRVPDERKRVHSPAR